MQASDCDITQILPATLETPVIYAGANEAAPIRFRHDGERVLLSASYTGIPDPAPLSFERSGPREKIAFDPAGVHAGILTCGGLCPGLNDVIRGLVRSAQANAIDSIYCQRLATEAVHAAMAGKSDMMVAKWNEQFVHIPLALVTTERKKIDPRSSTWRAVLEATGQPHLTQ